METTEITGLKELGKALRELPTTMANRALLGAVAKAATVVRKEAISRAPLYTGSVAEGHPPPGTLKRAMYQVVTSARGGTLKRTAFIGVRHAKSQQKVKRGKKTVNLDAFYWHMVEFGTVKMAAKPFLRPAFETTKVQAAMAIKEYLAQRLPLLAEQAKGKA